jgi:hypothetical protein
MVSNEGGLGKNEDVSGTIPASAVAAIALWQPLLTCYCLYLVGAAAVRQLSRLHLLRSATQSAFFWSCSNCSIPFLP